MREGLRLGFSTRRGGERGLGFGGGASAGEEVDFIGDRAGEVGEGFADVGGIVVGFVAVLGGDS